MKTKNKMKLVIYFVSFVLSVAFVTMVTINVPSIITTKGPKNTTTTTTTWKVEPQEGEHVIDMEKVVSIEATADNQGVYITFEDGTGYYWEK